MMKLFTPCLIFVALNLANAEEAVQPEKDSEAMTALQKKVSELTKKIDELELKIAVMNDRLGSQPKASLEQKPAAKELKTVQIKVHPAEGSTGMKKEDSPTIVVNSNETIATQKYRDALILFQSAKYPEAVLEFSNFIKENADHPLAGSAQYYVGESYMRQKEYRLASEEFSRVIATFPHSPHIADTMKRMSEAYEKLNEGDQSNKMKQSLLTQFPQSPAALAAIRGEVTTETENHPAKKTATANTQNETQEESHDVPTAPATHEEKHE